jgi:hypothetical protein
LSSSFLVFACLYFLLAKTRGPETASAHVGAGEARLFLPACNSRWQKQAGLELHRRMSAQGKHACFCQHVILAGKNKDYIWARL